MTSLFYVVKNKFQITLSPSEQTSDKPASTFQFSHRYPATIRFPHHAQISEFHSYPASHQQILAIRCNGKVTRMNSRRLIACLFQRTVLRVDRENSNAIPFQAIGSINKVTVRRNMNIRTATRIERISLIV